VWQLPENLLFHVLSFAEAPTHRASVLCHRLAPLCRASRRAILEDASGSVLLWNAVLREDYGVAAEEEEEDSEGDVHREKSCSSKPPGAGSTGSKRRAAAAIGPRRRRHSKRLRRSPVQRVRDAHQLMKDNTEIAFFYLSEMVAAAAPPPATPSSSSRPRRGRKNDNCLSVARLRGLLDEYGPHLRVNNATSNGGLYLVEVCRARGVSEKTVLGCVQELVGGRGCLVDLSTSESPSSCQTALCVASARAMPTVVRYLLDRGACPTVKSSGRFRLHANRQRTVRCTDETPVEFCRAMLRAETEAGAPKRDLRGLNECIRLLVERQQTTGR